MTNKYLEDVNGNKSSKRLFSAILLGIGILMTLITFVIALARPLGDSKTIIELIALILGIGGGLNGLGIFDTIFGKNKK